MLGPHGDRTPGRILVTGLLAQPRKHPGFHKLSVVEVRPLTPGSVTVTFAVPEGDEGERFLAFRAGQHLTLRAHLGGVDVRQSYSVCLSRHQVVAGRELRIAAARVDAGRMSAWLNDDVGAGDVIEVLPPMGELTLAVDPSAERHHVGIAGGSGITPVLSILRTALEEEPRSRVTVFYGNRTLAAAMFREELDVLAQTHPDRLRVVHVLSREPGADELRTGRIDRDRLPRLLAAYAPLDTVDDLYLCGPGGLVRGGRDALLAAGVPPQRIHHEVFYDPPGQA